MGLVAAEGPVGVPVVLAVGRPAETVGLVRQPFSSFHSPACSWDLRLVFNLSSFTPTTTTLVEMRHSKKGTVFDVTRGAGTAVHTVVVSISAKHVAVGYGGHIATSAETWADVRTSVDITQREVMSTVSSLFAIGALVAPICTWLAADTFFFVPSFGVECFSRIFWCTVELFAVWGSHLLE